MRRKVIMESTNGISVEGAAGAGPIAPPSLLSAAWPWFAIVVTAAATLYTARVTLRDFPNSADEYSYLISAQLFAKGRLSVPSPEPREFFDFIHVLNNGRFYGKYPPGWPLILSLGVLFGSPGFIPCLLGVAFLVLLYRLARENFSRDEAHLTLAVALCNPFLVFNGASLFSHMPCLFFSTLAIYFGCRVLREPAARLGYVALGCSAGVAFLIRPYTAVALLILPALYFPVHLAKRMPRRQVVANLVCAAGPVLACAGLLMLYNIAQGGDAIAGPYAQYDSAYRLARGPGSPDWSWALRQNLVDRIVALTTWIPLSGVLLLVFCADRGLHRDPRRWLLLLSFAGLMAGYFIYLQDPGNQYGPRYVFESCGAVMLLMGCVLKRLGKSGIVLAVAIVCGNLWVLAHETRQFSNQVRERMEVYEAVKRAKISRAVVFLRTGSGTMPPGDLTRNGISFSEDVLYVHDRGSDNRRLLEKHPDRKAFVYTYDPDAGRGRVSPY
jgi:hypothetical protein